MTTPPMRRAARTADAVLDREAGFRAMAKAMREVPEMTDRVVGTARQTGWLVDHSRPAAGRSGRWSTPLQGHPGRPDLTLVREDVPVVIVAELKRWGYGVKSLPDPNQARWLRAYGQLPGVYAVCWDTLDLVRGTISALLSDPAEVIRLAALPYQPKESQ